MANHSIARGSSMRRLRLEENWYLKWDRIQTFNVRKRLLNSFCEFFERNQYANTHE